MGEGTGLTISLVRAVRPKETRHTKYSVSLAGNVQTSRTEIEVQGRTGGIVLKSESTPHGTGAKNFLISLVRDVLERNTGDDGIDMALTNTPHVASLQASGYIGPDFHLSKDAFLRYFELQPSLTPPPEVLAWCTDFGVTEVRWKRVNGILKNKSRAFPALNVVVIRPGSRPSAWLHELAHLVFARILRKQIDALMKAAEVYPKVYSNGDTETVADPHNGRKAKLPQGLYLNINGFYCGLDHSGKENEDDELWASLFAQYCEKLPLHSGVSAALEKIIDGLRQHES